jgi:hypothetical protein
LFQLLHFLGSLNGLGAWERGRSKLQELRLIFHPKSPGSPATSDVGLNNL